jgi:predicted ATP-grasp superfamily ATP-dependent carboligase
VREYRNLSSCSSDEIVIQEYIEGTPASISFIAAYTKCKIISINEQLIGLKNIYQPEPFGYCGNITPYLEKKGIMEKCKKISNKITNCFKLVGSNGVDLVISENDIPYVIEVNPRFQGSLVCIERAYDINLVKLHLAACKKKEIEKNQYPFSLFSTRLIIFAPKRLIAPDLVSNPLIMDVPCPGSIIEKGEPICSVISDGKTKDDSLQRAQDTAKMIFNLIN